MLRNTFLFCIVLFLFIPLTMAGAETNTTTTQLTAAQIVSQNVSARGGLEAWRAVKDFVAGQKGRLVLEFLPAYAPELNPVEYLWGYWKQHELPNLCPEDFAELSEEARQALKRMRRRPRLITTFWKQAGLFQV